MKDEPAFPPPAVYHYPGLTKREWFAGMAMIGLIATNEALHRIEEIPGYALLIADAMLKQANESEQGQEP